MVALIVTGMIIWVVAAIVGLLLNADSKFIWTCIVGTLLGPVGIIYTTRRDRKSSLQ